MNGVLIIDKPEGFTSHDVVARARRILRTKRIGHTGTLDPFATGVLVILVGKATRLARFLDKDAKEYEAIVRFGFETDTGDRTGKAKSTENSKFTIQSDDIEKALSDFRGEIWQTPPMYSAKKIEGVKLYELARKGVEIERQPVRVTINELELINNENRKTQQDEFGLWISDVGFKVICSAGTYVRVLAEDVGRQIGVGAHLAELRRTRAGKFDISKSVTLEELEKIVSENRLNETLISMNAAVAHLAEVRLSEAEAAKIKNGLKLIRDLTELRDQAALRLTDDEENLLAIGIYDKSEKVIQPKLVLV